MGRQVVASDLFTGGIGSSWDDGPGAFDTCATQTGGHIKPSALDTPCAIRRNTGVFDADAQYCTVTVQAHGDGDSFNTLGALVNFQSGSTRASYRAQVLAANTVISTGNYIHEYPATGDPSELASGGSDRDLSAGDTVTLANDNGTLTMHSVEGGGSETQLLQTTDSTLTGGRPGVYMAYDASADTDCMITAWEGGDIVADPSGTGAQTFPGLTQSASGSETFSATAAQSLPSLAQSASGSETFISSADQTLPSLAQSASGAEVFQGSAAQDLPRLAQQGSGSAGDSSSAGQTLPSLAQAASGAEAFHGSAAQALPALLQVGSGLAVFTGTAAQLLPAIEQAASGTLLPDGTAAQDLPRLAQQGLEVPPVDAKEIELYGRLPHPSITGRLPRPDLTGKRPIVNLVGKR